MPNTRTCMALDLKNDPKLIAEYEKIHRPENIWPEIPKGIKVGGILDMQIYRIGNHLFMILDHEDGADLKEAFKLMSSMPRQPEWATFMAEFQQKLPEAKSDEHWAKMTPVFLLNDCL